MLFGYSDPARAEGQKLEFGFKHLLVTLWQNVYQLMKLNFCFLLFSIPIITIPAAMIALHAGCADLICGKKVSVISLFWRTIKKQLFQAWVVVLLMLVPLVVAVFNALFYCNQEQKIFLLPGLCMCVVIVMILLMLPYVFTMQARVALSIRKCIKNAFLLTFMNLPFTLCGSLIVLLIIVLSLLYWLYVLPLTLLMTIAVCTYIGVYFSLYALQKFVLTEEL